MPIFKFKETVARIAKERGIKFYGSHDDLLWQIEKDLKFGSIMPEDVTEKLKEHEDFRSNFTNDDFEAIVDATK